MSAVKMGLTIEEAAECTGIGRNTMRKLVEWGKLPVLKVGRKESNPKPSAFESEIHPSHKSSICTPGISPLQGASVSTACGV